MPTRTWRFILCVCTRMDENCNIYKNRRTIISGKLFDVLNNRNFTITIADEWGNDVNIPIE